MIQSRTAGLPLPRADDRNSVQSTIAQGVSISTRVGQSRTDDKFATTWQPVSPVADVPLMLSPVVFPFRLGRYDLLDVLGEGEMGAVFLACDRQLDRQVAMKIPRADRGRDATCRFEGEACVMAKVRHPNVCPIYDAGAIDGIPFLTMAYIEGRTLADRLAADSPPSDRQAARLVSKLASALNAVHEAGIIHRDVKPANIMIETSGEPILMDFGLAQSSRCSSASKGGLLGTPAYMPPEQVMRDVVGYAGDIYSLGVVMYEMLAGRIPFEGTLTDVLRQVVSEEPPPPSRFNPRVDPELEAICLRAMAKPVRNRFASAAALAAALN